MKKYYTALLMMVMALVSMTASAKTVYFSVDDQNNLGMCMDISTYNSLTFTNNTATLSTSSNAYVLLQGAGEWQIASVTCNGNNLASGSMPASQVQVYLGEVADGATINITTVTKAAASTKVFTLDGPDGLYVTCNGNQISWHNGSYTATMSEAWYAVSVYSNNGLTVRKVTADDGKVYTPNYGYVYIPGSDFNQSMHFVIDAGNADDARTAKLDVTVNGDASKVQMQRSSDYEYMTLSSNATTTIAFDPETEKNYTISPEVYGESFYRVTLNGVDVNPNGSRYSVTVTDGDEIVIDVDYPEEPAVVTFTFVNEGTEDAINRVTLNNMPIENWKDGINAMLGDKLGVETNTTMQINSIRVNGESFSNYGFQTAINKPVMKVVVDAKQPTMYTVHFDVEDASCLNVCLGYSTPIAIDEDNNIKVPSTSTAITVKAAQGWIIDYIGDLNTGTVFTTNYPFNVYDGQEIYVEATKLVREKQLTVYSEDASWSYRNLTLSSSNYEIQVVYQYYPDSDNNFPTGYMTVPFGSFDLPLSVNGWPEPIVFLNDDRCSRNSYGMYNGLDNVQDGDVLKLYASEPSVYELTYTFEEGVEAEIIHDRSRNIANPSNHSVTHGTEVTIRPVVAETPAARVAAREAAAPLAVKINDVDVAPAADGSYTFNVTEHTAVSVAKGATTGIENVEVTEASDDEAVYNLQGIRVNGSNLPAGFYIKGGKKVRL